MSYQDCRAHELVRANGAALPTYEEALELAQGEYMYKLYRDGIGLLSRGSDGGWHYREDAYSMAAARSWCAEKSRELARRIAADEVTGTLLFWGGSGWFIG
jgi:hypothetical protein